MKSKGNATIVVASKKDKMFNHDMLLVPVLVQNVLSVGQLIEP